MNAIVPIPRCDVNVRPATIDDVAFIDSLQKLHTRMVGWMPTKQLEGKIAAGNVLIAEGRTEDSGLRTASGGESSSLLLSPQSSALSPVGYCIGHDQYFKRDDVGIIYQMNVAPGRQRSFVGATLLRAMFDRAAYGCRLFCCWCAQDIEANRFWESMGFVPLAFRAGSEKKSRVHIFWQTRIRRGDTTTPWWFPSQTSAGSIREDRLVLPIPPGTHWSDAKPIILPGAEPAALDAVERKRLPGPGSPKRSEKAEKRKPAHKRQVITVASGLRFQVASDLVGEKQREAKPREAKRKRKNDPKYVAAARELRDRYLEHVNAGGGALTSRGKYDVSRILSSTLSGVEGSAVEGSRLTGPASAPAGKHVHAGLPAPMAA